MKIIAPILIMATLAACADLPAPRNSDGTPYLSPACKAHIAELRALPMTYERLPPDHLFWRMNPGFTALVLGDSDHVVIRADLQFGEEEDDHERCHRWTRLKTGSPDFHARVMP